MAFNLLGERINADAFQQLDQALGLLTLIFPEGFYSHPRVYTGHLLRSHTTMARWAPLVALP